MKILLGADPEVFFDTPKGLISSIGLIGGTKDSPIILGDGYAVLEDNVTAEFNVPPSETALEFNTAIKRGLFIVEQFANKADAVISLKASAHFSKKELKDPRAKEFGCEPDYNAWSGAVNDKPSAEADFRTCGGHVHVGGVSDIDPLRIIRAMDLYLGVPSVILDSDTERRTLYGKAGSFRPKPYGVEYRTLSNFWIFSEELRNWVWNTVPKAVQFAEKMCIESDSALAHCIQTCINESDIDIYNELIREFPDIRPEVIELQKVA